MKRIIPYIIYIVLLTISLASCSQQELPAREGAMGTLCLSLSRQGVPQIATRAVDSDLALTLTRGDGSVYKAFPAGGVPASIQVEAGVTYTLCAYTDNQDTWQTANSGKGEACYWGETTVSVGEDETVYCTYRVPMLNYAVTLTLPELFDALFTSYTFSLASQGRETVSIREGEKAYFAVDAGFTYRLTATNNDNKTSSHSAIEYPDVEAGKLYNIKYVYGSDINQGGIDIEITDDEEHEDVDIEI